MSILEWVAAIAGAVSVWLATREHILSWPIGIVNVALYSVVFFRAGLYSDMGLQVVYLLLSIYGWYQWLHGGEHRTELAVTRTPRVAWAVSAGIGVIAWWLLARYTATLPGVSFPHLDAALTVGSLVAQWLMTRKHLESWIVWIAVDLVYVPLYVIKDLPVTAVLYAVFLALAVLGLRDWRRSWRAAVPREVAPA